MSKKINICQNCGFELTTTSWRKDTSNELRTNDIRPEILFKNSLSHNPEKTVYCAECDVEVGTGKDYV